MIAKNLLHSLVLNSKHLIPGIYDSDNYPYLEVYFNASSDFDFKYLGVDFSTLETVTDSLAEIESLVKVCINSHKFKYDKIWAVNNAEYNPIWNVDGTETETHDIAKRKNTDNYGESVMSSSASQVPDDMTTEKETNSSESTREAYTDTHEEDAYQDVITKTRGGNIGVTMTQQLIEAERKIADYNMIDVIMRDILECICYPTFGEE